MSNLSISVALVGNPNTGKSTLFNALTGLRQHVGNYPGVTVEKKTGVSSHHGHTLHLIDLPGTYSLAARSPDEMVAVDVLLGHLADEPRPDVIISIVDASNLDRHLYLTTQLMELGIPIVLALNMIDVAEKQGVVIDHAGLQQRLGLPIVPIRANQGIGLNELKQAVVQAVGQTAPTGPTFPNAFDREVDSLQAAHPDIEPFLIRRLLLDVNGYTEQQAIQKVGPSIAQTVQAARERLKTAGIGVPGVEARTRFQWIRQAIHDTVKRSENRKITLSDRIDRILTHRYWGTLIFALLMFAVFQAIFNWADIAMGWIDESIGMVSDWLKANMAPGPFRSLVTDGILAGVGGVIVFLPQIVILFGFIAVLEDCGYMARAAFLMDRIMARVGLNGKSFIPLLSSVACAVPGVMATRVIENRRDRLATILVAPLMSCSARLPVYTLLIGMFFSEPWWLPGVVLFAMHGVGFIVAPLVALTLKKTLLRGATPLFVMELPAFKWPSFRTICRRMFDAGWAFVRRAGTLILAAMVLVWAMLYFPRTTADGRDYETVLIELESQMEEAANDDDRAALEASYNEQYGNWKRDSILGRMGRTLEPMFTPLGWDWKIGMAALASFPAREVVVGTLGIIYNQGDVDPGAVGDEDDEQANRLKSAIGEDWAANPLIGPYRHATAVSLMVFFALCCQCVSTLAVIRRETRSWAWTIFTFVYMTVLAYVAALIVFQVGKLIIG